MNFLAFGKMNKNLVTLASGTTVAQFVPVIITPFLTRLYKPAEFGVFGVYFSIVTLLVIFACGRYEQAIVLPEEDSDARSLTLLCIYLTFIFSISIFIILISANKFYNISFDDQSWIWLLPFGVLLTSLYQVLNYWFTRQQVFKQISLSRIIQAISIVMFQSILGLFGFLESLDGLVFGYLIGVLLSNLYLLTFISKSNLSLADSFNLETFKKLMLRYVGFPRVNLWSSLLGSASIQLPILLLSKLFGQSVAGMYSLANRAINIPMSTVGGAMGQVYLAEASKISHRKESLAEITLTHIKTAMLIGLFPTSLILAFGPLLFRLIFGNDWERAGFYAQFLSLWFFLILIASPISNILTILEMHRQNFIFNSILLTSRIVTLFMGVYFFKADTVILIYGVVGAVIWMLFSWYLLIIVNAKWTDLKRYIFSTSIILTLSALLGYSVNGGFYVR